MRSQVRLAILATLLTPIGAHSSVAAEPTVQILTAGCTTDATGGDGVRHGCDSPPTIITAPPGHVFIQNHVEGGETSGAGDEHSCGLIWSNYVEVLPNTGITQPRTATAKAHARGPSGHWAGRGWVSCEYKIRITRYSNEGD